MSIESFDPAVSTALIQKDSIGIYHNDSDFCQ